MARLVAAEAANRSRCSHSSCSCHIAPGRYYNTGLGWRAVDTAEEHHLAGTVNATAALRTRSSVDLALASTHCR